jgi:hypothetical protein
MQRVKKSKGIIFFIELQFLKLFMNVAGVNNKQQARLNLNGCSFASHLVADAACFM